MQLQKCDYTEADFTSCEQSAHPFMTFFKAVGATVWVRTTLSELRFWCLEGELVEGKELWTG